MTRAALVLVVVGLAAPAAAAPASQPASAPARAPAPGAAAPASAPAAAVAPTAAPASAPRRARGPHVNWYVDLPVTGGLGVTALGVEMIPGSDRPTRCRWCEPHLNGFDAAGRHLRWSNKAPARTISNVTGYALTPAVTMGLVNWSGWREGGWRQAAADDVLILESAAVASLMTQGLKYATARKRPFVRDLPAGSPTGGDDNLSFPSGHTTLAFSIATAAGTIATMRGYRTAPYVWATGMALAAFTAYLRLAADQHYATDVLVGAAVGSLVGWAVPYLLHRRWRR